MECALHLKKPLFKKNSDSIDLAIYSCLTSQVEPEVHLLDVLLQILGKRFSSF